MVRPSVRLVFVFAGLLIAEATAAADWPSLRHDQRRSGVASEQIDASRLALEWTFETALPPISAWPDAAKWDAYATVDGLRSMRNYDPVLHPIVAKESIFLPSNIDDTVRCLDLNSGKARWQFTADGPVRIAPTYHQDHIYFGSDDGSVYCLSASSGSLVWKNKVDPDARSFINDGRICSYMPVRTGVLIDDAEGVGVVSAGLFPWETTLLVALDLRSGEVRWTQELGKGWTLEGAMLLSPRHIIAPQGRAAPQLFDRTTGKPAGTLPGGGGSFVLLTDDEKIFHGPGNKAGWLTESDPEEKDGKGNIEKVASFERGTAIVVQDRFAYLLDDQRVAAFDRQGGEFVWITPCPASHELIMAGDFLFAGGDSEVWAFHRETGQPIWRSTVDGRAMGLAVAGGKLLVSTDKGQLAVFAEGVESSSPPQPVAPVGVFHFPAKEVVIEPSPLNGDSLLQRWVFHRDQLDGKGLGTGASIRSLADGPSAPLPAGSFLAQIGEEQALLLDGRVESEIAKDFHTLKVPTNAFTVEAVVRIDKPLEWGGLVSVTQDNGDYEKGWILGYKKDKFGFAVNGGDGPDRLVWITDTSGTIEPERWYHVVGVYDGNEARLYVNGRRVASSSEPSGDIRYPENAAFHVGAYKDDDEHFVATGMLNEVVLLGRASTEEEISLRTASIIPRFPEPPVVDKSKESTKDEILVAPDRGPILRFISRGTAEVTWWTQAAQTTRLELVDGVAEVSIDQPESLRNEHRAIIRGLGSRTVSHYQILHQLDGGEFRSPKYECDTHFDYNRSDLPESQLPVEVVERAKKLLDLVDRNEPRGLAILWGCGDEAKLAEAICRLSGLDVIVCVDNENELQLGRGRLIEAGMYGRLVSMRLESDAAKLPFPQRAFDLILDLRNSDAETIKHLSRLVQPGGALVVEANANTQNVLQDGFVVVDRSDELSMQWLRGPRIEGAASWTHMYATPENTAYAGETLSGVRGIDDVRVAWAGRPGPRYQSDRGNRKPSPLAAGGRLFLQGLYRTIAVDAYNGTILWSLEMPEVVRFNVPRDCSNWCVDESNVYISSDERCLVVDGATGKIKSEYDVNLEVQGDTSGPELNWGYVARQSNMLIGTGVRPNNVFTEYWGGEFWYDSKDGEHAKKVCSENVFSMDPLTGERRWNYQQGLIVNPTITISGERIYFVECRAKELMDGESRRLDGDAFWNNLYLVALDMRNGKIVWETEAKPLAGQSAFYLVYANEKLLMQTSQGGKFALYAIDARDGKGLWRGLYAWQADHHGKHLSRPAVVENTVYLRPLTIDLEDGRVISKTFPDGHQCGTYTCSKDAVFMRAGSLAVWDRQTAESTRWDRLRPDCWISTIPAEGMLLSPEGGGGCSCGGWIETSIGFAPKWDEL